jgi:hypothetical protein
MGRMLSTRRYLFKIAAAVSGISAAHSCSAPTPILVLASLAGTIR